MTLLDQCQDLRQQIERRNELRRAHKDAEVFREHESDLRELRQSLQNAFAKIEVLRAKGVVVGKLPDSNIVATLLQDHRKRLADAPLDMGRDYARLKRAIEKIKKDVFEAADKALESVKRDLPAIEEAFLKQVELIPSYKEQVILIRTQRDQLLTGVHPRLMTADQLAQFLDQRDALRSLADQLNPEEFPQEVMEFYKAARHGGATLEKLTATVRQWLADRNQLRNVRIMVIDRT